MVRGNASGTALAGAVVELRDSSSRDLAQATTNSRGAFLLRAPGAGSYVIRVRHIGFRPSDVRIRLSGLDTTLAIVMDDVPTALSAVVSKSSGQCRAHPESGSATWALWENAEVAILNATITMRDQLYKFDAEFATRMYDIDPATLNDLAIRDSTIRDGRPWTSVRPEVLARSGFAVETASEMTVIAPDLPVLLSRDFLDGHCFAVHAASAIRPGLVGLDFAPVARGRHVDIRGTFWLDRRSGEVRYLDYYYAGFPFSMNDTLPGGRVNFTRLSTGSWILSSWIIRAPLPSATYLEQTVLTTALPSRAVESGDAHFRATEFRTTGGGVREVRQSDGADSSLIWSAPVSALRVSVAARSGTGTVPADGATVSLVGSRRQAVTDSNGVARMEGLLEGDYIVEATAPLQASLRLPPTRFSVTVAPPADLDVHALVMSAPEAVHAACGAMNATRGILVGTVTRNDAPEPRAHIMLRSDVDPGYSPSEVKPSSDGTFRICDVPTGEGLTVLAVLSDPTLALAYRTQVKAHVTIPGDRMYEAVDLVLPPDP